MSENREVSDILIERTNRINDKIAQPLDRKEGLDSFRTLYGSLREAGRRVREAGGPDVYIPAETIDILALKILLAARATHDEFGLLMRVSQDTSVARDVAKRAISDLLNRRVLELPYEDSKESDKP